MRYVAQLLTLVTLFGARAVMAAPPHAHQHGAVTLAVAIDGEQLSIAMEAPLDSLLGFERAPRSEAERRAASELLARLRNGGAALFKPDAAARCTLVTAQVRADVLEPAAQPAPKDGEHADIDADYAFKCTSPNLLRSVDVGLLDAFKRIRRIEVQVVGPKGQHKATLERPARTIPMQR
ncbi:DUF2796 domain-containing protein [Aquincola sp. S2]|uniref:DUF2796 domain-containing protein n=1 Tax=Pseudaquabacterium terrae TaxID=2732868 RepID=A0ABX2EGF7_9BURK|nr:DUF2796 domain-containing protein [Aquabacterium terrae]NRF67690.1 DUF2796 domain-containing protein [Aquabacterium terrae]